jgi:hypothetical protein
VCINSREDYKRHRTQNEEDSNNTEIITVDINEFMKCLVSVYFVFDSKITHLTILYLANLQLKEKCMSVV